MKKIKLAVIIVVIVLWSNGMEIRADELTELKVKIESLESANKRISDELSKASSNIKMLEIRIKNNNDSLILFKRELNENEKNIQQLYADLGKQIKVNSEKSDAEISTLNDTLSKNTLYWIIAVLGLGLMSILFYWILKNKLYREKNDLNQNIKKTSDALREEQVKLDEQFLKVLNTQLQIMTSERQSQRENEEIDHSLALKVADEIVRIQKNLNQMDKETRGLKQLSASVIRIKDNFAANGYEMIEMLGEKYKEGMRVDANFRPDEKLKPGEQIITRIIKPQVNYKGKMIQPAQIEVSSGE
jgi:septal ring factor EnvC (AmiA/AmiB activator)